MSSEGSIDDAMARLVFAMLGHEDPVATSLSRRVLKSQLGSSEDDIVDVTSTWRRMARKAPDAQCCADVEALYLQLQAQSGSHLPPKMLAVLTKLMGKQFQLPETTVRSTRSEVPSPLTRTASMGAPVDRRREVGRTLSARALPSPAHSTERLAPSVPATPAVSVAGAGPVPSRFTPRHEALRPQQSNHLLPQTRGHIEDEKRALEQEEALLLKECLYSLQGIDGERIRYYHKENSRYGPHQSHPNALMDYDGIRVQSPALSLNLLYTGRVLETRLGTGAMDALRISGEAGWLYQRIQSFIQEVQHDDSKGVVARAFAGSLGQELREYHSLLTQYESQLPQMSLRQLLVDLRMPTSRLHILALLADGLRHMSGGNLLSGLYRHALHGDSRHSQLAQNILCSASRPWFDILFTWTTQGVLSDPHGEFFVTEITTVEDKHLWNDKYRVNNEQIPEGILPVDVVEQILNVGKGINFIRRCLLDSRWSMQLDEPFEEDDTITTSGSSEQLGFVYVPYSHVNLPLERTLERAARLVHSHILRTLREDNRMMQHLFALKQFLFLGQGDFVSALIDGLHSEFRDRPDIVGVYKHSLLSIVESALRSTNAKYLPQFVLDRLQVELLVDSDDPAYGAFGSRTRKENEKLRTVWDVFMIDYQVPDPLRAIVHPRNMGKYKLVFSLLFRLRKIEFMLNYTWRQSATLHHALQTYGQYNGINIQNNSSFAQAYGLLRKISISRQNMIHLVVNLKSYLMFEVVEGGWQKLQLEIESATTLDEVIEAHDLYIDGIVRKSLLRSVGEKDDEIQARLANHVQILMDITLEFCDYQERLFHESLVMADRATQKRIEADRRVNEGRWGFDAEREIAEEEHFFGLADEGPLQEVNRISSVYNQNFLDLLCVLSDRVNANPDDLASNVVEEGDNDEGEGRLSSSGGFNSRQGRRRRKGRTVVVEDELDSQRFLIAQLDHNNYFGEQGYGR